MCIRDRAIRAHLGSEVSFLSPVTFLVGENGSGKSTFLEGICLLYTSDAADERSSVDLGGRRIIKKKKTVESGDAGGIY